MREVNTQGNLIMDTIENLSRFRTYLYFKKIKERRKMFLSLEFHRNIRI